MRVWIPGLLLASALTLVPTPSNATSGPPSYHTRVYDVECIPRTYYFVADRPVTIDEVSLRVWRDDGIQTNNFGATRGLARRDATMPPDSSENPELQGNFDLLMPTEDYTILTRPVDDKGEVAPVPVIRLTRPPSAVEILAVSYVDEATLPSQSVGIVSNEADSALAKPEGWVLLQAVKIMPAWISRTPAGAFNPQDPWFPLLSYELRNLYDLGIEEIPMDRLRIRVRKISAGEDPEEVFGITYLEYLGLDQRGSPEGPDGFVDEAYVDAAAGILFFPDHHPFDPDTTSSGCPPGRGGFLCLDNLERNVLRRNHPEWLAQSNPNVYFDPHLVPAEDSRFYLEVTILPPPQPGAVLHQNAPNPFNPETVIRFDLNTSEWAKITVLDIRGRVVARLLDAELAGGPHQVSWSGRDEAGRAVASGVYFYRLETPGTEATRKMVLAR